MEGMKCKKWRNKQVLWIKKNKMQQKKENSIEKWYKKSLQEIHSGRNEWKKKEMKDRMRW